MFTNTCQTTGSLLWKKLERSPPPTTRRNMDYIGLRSEECPRTHYTAYWRKSAFHRDLYRQPHDCLAWNHMDLELCTKFGSVSKIRFYNWFYERVCSGEVGPSLTCFTGEITYIVTKNSGKGKAAVRKIIRTDGTNFRNCQTRSVGNF